MVIFATPKPKRRKAGGEGSKAEDRSQHRYNNKLASTPLPGGNFIKLIFSLSLAPRQNKLKCLYLPSFFRVSLIFACKAAPILPGHPRKY
jgi:hypothetical protein